MSKNQQDNPIISLKEDFYKVGTREERNNEGHTLILPKKHYLDVEVLDMKTANAIMEASMKISKAIKKKILFRAFYLLQVPLLHFPQ